MPNRIIRESCRTSPTLALLSDGAERLFWRLTTFADDHGRFEAAAPIVRGGCLPMIRRVTDGMVDRWMVELEGANLIQHYMVGGKLFGFFTTWQTHQRVRSATSKYPAPSDDSRCPRLTPNVPVVGSTGVQESRVQESAASALALAGPPAAAPEFKIPSSITDALNRAPALGKAPRLRDPAWWQAQIRANPGVDLAAELLKAEAWMRSNPSRAPKSEPARFLHSWLRRADRESAS